jgi:hypothetical protein
MKTEYRTKVNDHGIIKQGWMGIFGLEIQFFEFSRGNIVQTGDITGDLIWKESCLKKKERGMRRKEIDIIVKNLDFLFCAYSDENRQ